MVETRNGPSNRFLIPPIWRGKTVLIVAGGPSLTASDVASARKHVDRTIAINNAVDIAPDADMLWFTDAKWAGVYRDRVERFSGRLATLENYHLQDEFPGIWCVHNLKSPPFYEDGDGIYPGNCGGYAALHLAAVMGAEKIVLIGYDCKLGTGIHWHGRHESPLHNPSRSMADEWVEQFSAIAPALFERGIDVVNVTRDTALMCFRRADPCAPFA